MKKNKILIPALAVLALGIAGATSGTVAWFTATQAAQFNTAVAGTQGVSTEASSITLGKFTLTAVPASPSVAAVSLTDSTGKSYVYLDAEGTQKVSAVATHPVSTIACALKIQYFANGSDPLPSAGDIANIWLATIGTKNITISVTSDANVRFLASAAPAAEADWAGTVGTTGVSLTIQNSALKLASFANTGIVSENISAGSVYVAVTGQEEVETAQSHTVTFTPTNP